MNAGRTIYRKYASLSGPEFLEETDSLSFTVHQLLIAPQRGLQLHSRSPIHTGILSDSILYRLVFVVTIAVGSRVQWPVTPRLLQS